MKLSLEITNLKEFNENLDFIHYFANKSGKNVEDVANFVFNEIYTFLDKNKSKLNVKNVLRMLNNYGPGNIKIYEVINDFSDLFCENYMNINNFGGYEKPEKFVKLTKRWIIKELVFFINNY